jgi:hypothetical protein
MEKTGKPAALDGFLGALCSYLVAMFLQQRTKILRWRFKDGQGKLKEEPDQIRLVQLPALTNSRHPRVIGIRNLDGHCLMRLLSSTLSYGPVDDVPDELMLGFGWRRGKLKRFMLRILRLL